MFIKEHYRMNQQFMYMMGHYDRYGKLCTVVTEMQRTFIVDLSPVEILDESIKSIGYDLRGALSTSKWLLGDIQMCPIMVNPIERIVVFPTKSAKHEETIWFNPNHISRTTSSGRNTCILFSNGSTLALPTRLSAFNTKIQNAEQLENLTAKMRGNTFTFIVDPKKRRFKKKQK